MQIPLCGAAYKHPSIDVNYQRCINFYPTQCGPDGRGKFTLLLTAGLKLLINLGTGPIRCMGEVDGFVYAVVGQTFYKITVNTLTKTASSTVIGSINSSSQGTIYMAANPTQVMWVDGTANGYIYTPGTGVFQKINDTDADFTGGSSVVCIDGYFIVNQPGTAKMFFSSLNNGLAWNPADVATAATSTDNLVFLGLNKGELWAIGEKTTEIWYDAGNVPPGSPFSARQGLQMQIGCGARDSVSSVNDLLIWLDHRGFIVQSAVSPYVRSNNTGYDLKIISDESMTTEILSYSRRDDAVAMSYNERGHIMYQITFPTAKKTWVYDYTSSAWHERSYYDSYNQERQHHLGQFYCSVGPLHIMSGIRDGKIYLSSSDYTNDDGVRIIRTRTTPVQYDSEDHRLMGCARLDLRVGIETHNLPDPRITLRYSKNGGHTWSNHLPRSLGRVGEYAKPVSWNRLGTAREWVFEFETDVDMKFSLIDAVARPTEFEG